MRAIAEDRARRTDRRSVDIEALYARERDGLVRLAFLLTGSQAVAEDVFADAFARVIPRLDQIDSPGAYLRTAVVNGARSVLRRVPPPLPELVAAKIETRSVELWEALAGLSERRRTALVLRYYLDLSTEEIAAAMDCRPGTVSSLLHRGLADLRKELRDD